MKEFEFVNEGRTFSCSVETPSHAGMRSWWFFRLDNETSTRYAPFEASASDTPVSVKRRIIAYYAEMQEIKARPAYVRPAWRKPGTQAPAEGTALPPDGATTLAGSSENAAQVHAAEEILSGEAGS